MPIRALATHATMSAPAFDRSELKTLCELARLNLPVEREDEVLAHLQRIVAAFAALRSVETQAATSPPAAAALRLRPDEPGRVLPRDLALANAPQQAADMFLVPRVVDA